MKGLDNNEEAKNLVENFKGSTENRMRSLYNLGYWQGFNDGQREAVQMLERALMDMTAEQTEPQRECEKCKHFREEAEMYTHQCEFYFMECKFEPKTEPQTEREGE